jgi:hypothetical protein
MGLEEEKEDQAMDLVEAKTGRALDLEEAKEDLVLATRLPCY